MPASLHLEWGAEQQQIPNVSNGMVRVRRVEMKELARGWREVEEVEQRLKELEERGIDEHVDTV